jgi:hypothetical protein
MLLAKDHKAQQAKVVRQFATADGAHPVPAK